MKILKFPTEEAKKPRPKNDEDMIVYPFPKPVPPNPIPLQQRSRKTTGDIRLEILHSSMVAIKQEMGELQKTIRALLTGLDKMRLRELRERVQILEKVLKRLVT